MDDLLSNPWIIAIGSSMISGLILYYVFRINSSKKYSVEELKEMFKEFKQFNNQNSVEIIINPIVNNLTTNNYQNHEQSKTKN